MKLNNKELEIINVSGHRTFAFCPFHNDTKKPNLEIQLSGPYKGRYFCWACGKAGWLDKPWADLPVLLDKHMENQTFDWKTVISDTLSFHNLHGQQLREQLNIGYHALSAYLVGWWKNSYVIPMRESNMDIIGAQRRFKDGFKCCVTGSRLGLFIPVFIPKKTQHVLFVCEGWSDAASLYDLGYFAIARPSTTVPLINEIKEFIKLKNFIDKVVIVCDNDDVGIEAGSKLRFEIMKEIICDLDIPTIMKDIREEIKVFGKDEIKYLFDDRYFGE